jgi:Flp pilus assembly protein TadG
MNVLTLRKLARRLRDDPRGTAALEFAALLPVYALFTFGLMQVAVVHFARATLESAAESAARQLLVNADNGFTQAQFKAQVCGYLPRFMSCDATMVDVQLYSAGVNPYPSLTYDTSDAVTNGWSVPACLASSCAAQQLMVRVMYPWPVLSLPLGVGFGDMANGSLLLMSVQVLQVEP